MMQSSTQLNGQWPARLGGYDVVRTLSAGGMGAVLLGEKRVTAPGQGGPGFTKRVAIKVILPHLLSDENARELFFDEARLAARLVHPNLVQTFDFGEEAGVFYLVMELVDGKSVLELLRTAQRPLPPLLCARIVADAGRGLAWAHALADDDGKPLQVVHRDVSPDNLLLARLGAVKVLDFGVAKSRHRTSVSVVGMVRGKPPYMAPEQVYGDDVDARSDCWSLGVVLHELLSGEKLFKGQGVAVFEAVAKMPLPPPPPQTPQELKDVVAAMLQRDRKQRLTMSAAVERLDRFLHESGGSMTPGALRAQLDEAVPGLFAGDTASVVDAEGRPDGVRTAPASVGPPAHVPTTPLTLSTTKPSPTPSQTRLAAAALAVVACVAVAVVVVVMRGRDAAIPPVIDAGAWVAAVARDSGVAAVEPVVVEPVAVEPVAVEPVVVEPVVDAGVVAGVVDAGSAAKAVVAAAVAADVAGEDDVAVVSRRPSRKRPRPRAQEASAGLYVPDRNPYVDVLVDGVRVGVSPLGTAKKPFVVSAGDHVIQLVEPATGALVLKRRLSLDPGEVQGVR